MHMPAPRAPALMGPSLPSAYTALVGAAHKENCVRDPTRVKVSPVQPKLGFLLYPIHPRQGASNPSHCSQAPLHQPNHQQRDAR